jgi:rhodanese-related sulfurtransferase
MSTQTVTPQAAKDERANIVDVREPYERASERISGTRAMPLSKFDVDALRVELGEDADSVIFQCRSGARSQQACERFGGGRSLAGGIEAWKAAGLPTERAAGAPKMDVMRQVQITAGSLVVLGVLLGWFVSPWFLALSLFIGSGLVFAGVSGWCGMAKLLATMPWNRPTSTVAA